MPSSLPYVVLAVFRHNFTEIICRVDHATLRHRLAIQCMNLAAHLISQGRPLSSLTWAAYGRAGAAPGENASVILSTLKLDDWK